MTARDEALLRESQELFARILMKFDLMEKLPFIFGRESISRAQLHMIEAIGKGCGSTVTALAEYFMVTKGAVSQIVSKLCARGLVSKSRSGGGGKEVLLELTKRGWEAFEIHEGYSEFGPDIISFAEKYEREELRAFLNVLKGLDELSGRLFAELAEKSRKSRDAGIAPASPSGAGPKKRKTT
jgi:DNA-binding MarR family transcriptional regulator